MGAAENTSGLSIQHLDKIFKQLSAPPTKGTTTLFDSNRAKATYNRSENRNIPVSEKAERHRLSSEAEVTERIRARKPECTIKSAAFLPTVCLEGEPRKQRPWLGS